MDWLREGRAVHHNLTPDYLRPPSPKKTPPGRRHSGRGAGSAAPEPEEGLGDARAEHPREQPPPQPRPPPRPRIHVPRFPSRRIAAAAGLEPEERSPRRPPTARRRSVPTAARTPHPPPRLHPGSGRRESRVCNGMVGEGGRSIVRVFPAAPCSLPRRKQTPLGRRRKRTRRCLAVRRWSASATVRTTRPPPAATPPGRRESRA